MTKHNAITSNAVIYARYSPGPNQNEQSIEGQVHDCTEYCSSKGLTVLRVYADRHMSGTESEHRDEFQRMLRDAQTGTFSYVVVWKIDRFGRNREEISINKVHLKKCGVAVLYAKEQIPEGPEGIILESMLEGMAEYYSAELSQKIIRGQRESVSKGRMISPFVPFGYFRDQDLKIEIDLNSADVVKHIFKMYISGELIRDILYDLEDKGIKNTNGKKFNYNSIRRILSNRNYIGEYTFGPNSNDSTFPKIIDTDIFFEAQKRVNNLSVASISARNAAMQKATVNYFLSGKISCGVCGHEYHGASGRSHTGQKYYYYICNGKKKHHTNCHAQNISKEILEDFVFEKTIHAVLNDGMIDQIADQVVSFQKSEDENYAMNTIKKNLSDCDKSITNIMKAIEAGIITETTLSRLKELEAEKKSLQVSLAQANMQHIVFTKNQIIYYLNQFVNGDTPDEDVPEKISEVFINQIIIDKMNITIVYNLINTSEKLPISQLLEMVRLRSRQVDDSGAQTNPVLLSSELFMFTFSLVS